MPKFKLAVFDIDDTLAGINKPIPSRVLKLLKKLYGQGTQLCLASGKPTDNIHGFVRQTGLQDVIVIGENGYLTYIGGKFPPDEIYPISISEKDRIDMQNLKNELFKQKFVKNKDAWIQPISGYINFTYKNENFALRDEAKKWFKMLLKTSACSNFEMFCHSDSIEIVIKGINKGTTIKQVCDKIGITPNDVVAVGNGENDIPMFEVAGFSLGVNLPTQFQNKVNKHFNNIETLLKYLLKINKI